MRVNAENQCQIHYRKASVFFKKLCKNTLGQKASKMDSYQYVYDAMMIPFDTCDMQSIRENNFLDKTIFPSNDLDL